MAEVLPIRMVEKPWGREVLPPPFTTPAGKRIGEIWFEPPPELPELLVKYIFTSEALSVQVHPSDAQTEAAGLGRQGKEECWLIIAADPGARIGIGFDSPIGPAALRAAAEDGSIEQLMTWFPVTAGDFFYIPANTVHAIGAGVSLVEIQQNSDITYRLYDYGRPRELHLEQGMAVARGEPYGDAHHCRLPTTGSVRLVDGPFFELDRLSGGEIPGGHRPLLVMPLTGVTWIDDRPVTPGACAAATGAAKIRSESESQALVIRSVPTGSREATTDHPGKTTD
jgi:mannose-6-phosphate isomerase